MKPAPPAAALLEEAERLERTGASGEAMRTYLAAVEATAGHVPRVEARALWRMAILRLRESDLDAARALAARSHAVAVATGEDLLTAEALNVCAVVAFEAGDMNEARRVYDEALRLGGADPSLRARVEQNLGILANIQGSLDLAYHHYHSALDACAQLGDLRGVGLAYNNLGMLHADQELWEEADRCFAEGHRVAAELGDAFLVALCALNHCEVHLARQRYDLALESAEFALAGFERIGSRLDKADAYRVIGTVYREMGRLELAEARLRMAREVAASAGSPLGEAEAARELALVYQGMARNQEALHLLSTAHRLFARLDARRDMVDVSRRRDRLERTYLAVVRDWGQSIESADRYTYGHCERVAQYAVAVARALGLDDAEITTIRLGAYLHDLGKIRVPHEILNKPDRLTDEEMTVVRKHPVWGVELLATIEFPWDIKPIIRWHHERYDGTGYPDQLKGDEIPLAAQILCVVDIYDALTTSRSYRPALPHHEAVALMLRTPSWWRPDVLDAFLAAILPDGAAA